MITLNINYKEFLMDCLYKTKRNVNSNRTLEFHLKEWRPLVAGTLYIHETVHRKRFLIK